MTGAVVNNGTTEGLYFYVQSDHMNRPVATFQDGADGTQAYGITYTPFGETHTLTGLSAPELGFPFGGQTLPRSVC